MNAELEKWIEEKQRHNTSLNHHAIHTDDLRALFDGKVLVPVDELAVILDLVRDSLQGAYQSATPVCCGKSWQECCGNPDPEWSAEDSAIMESLGPIEKSITAMLAASQEPQS